eukprot:353077-Chlamydomonas_euryale.AAC.10
MLLRHPCAHIQGMHMARAPPAPSLAVPDGHTSSMRPTHRSQRPRAWAGVGLPTGHRRHDAAVGHDDDVLAGELLLQLAHQAQLDLLKGLEKAVRDLQHGEIQRRLESAECAHAP